MTPFLGTLETEDGRRRRVGGYYHVEPNGEWAGECVANYMSGKAALACVAKAAILWIGDTDCGAVEIMSTDGTSGRYTWTIRFRGIGRPPGGG